MTDLRKLSEAATPGEWEAEGDALFIGSKCVGVLDTDNDTPTRMAANAALAAAAVNEFRSGSLIPRSEYERVLAMLIEARDALRIAERAQAAIDDAHDQDAGTWGLGRLYEAEQLVHAAGNAARASLSRIDDALASDVEARG